MITLKKSFTGLAFVLVSASSINVAHANTVEPFAGGQLSASGWSSPIGTDAGAYGINAAPDGSYGIALSDGVWSYNTSIQFLPGDTLSAWINPGPSATSSNNAQGGRIYLGFDAGATVVPLLTPVTFFGTQLYENPVTKQLFANQQYETVNTSYSFVAASDTNQLGFQTNVGDSMSSFSGSAAQSYLDQWYFMTIGLSANGSSATANLYDTDGVTLLSSVTETGLSSSNTGIALRGIGGAAITSLSITAVPLPAALWLFAPVSGFLLMLSRRRKGLV
ncbi:MAG: hypothetical protein WCS87_04620 [Methylococcaceae bacterium]